jgi:hypothetical protein
MSLAHYFINDSFPNIAALDHFFDDALSRRPLPSQTVDAFRPR